jgi:hypothetical protein
MHLDDESAHSSSKQQHESMECSEEEHKPSNGNNIMVDVGNVIDKKELNEDSLNSMNDEISSDDE